MRATKMQSKSELLMAMGDCVAVVAVAAFAAAAAAVDGVAAVVHGRNILYMLNGGQRCGGVDLGFLGVVFGGQET